MRLLQIALAILMSVIAGSCSLPVGPTDLTGTYEVSYDYGLETLLLKADGTYHQCFRDKNGVLTENDGKWEFTGKSSVFQNRLLLEDALVLYRLHGEPPSKVKKMNWLIEPRKSIWGSVTLIFNEDLDLAYKKNRE